MKKTFKINICLIFSLVFVAATGLGNHLAGPGHGGTHQVWEVWSYVHILAAGAFLTLAVLHLRLHWAWYKGLLRSAKHRKKNRVTIFLSVLFTVCALTGLTLLAIFGADTHLGLLHYGLGLAMSLIALLHFFKRLPIFCKGVFGAN